MLPYGIMARSLLYHDETHKWGFLADPLEVGSALHLILRVCLTDCPQLTKLFNIFASGWHISLNFFGDISRMFLHYFQITPNFLYVCQSVSWLNFLLKLDKYRDISSSVWDIFLKFFGGIPGMFLHLFQIILNFMYVCQSVSLLTSLLKLYKHSRKSPIKFSMISHPELEIFLYEPSFCKEASQLTDWQTYKKFRIIWN